MTAVEQFEASYARQQRLKQFYTLGFLALLIYVASVSFLALESWNAGSFWNGLHRLGDYPAAIIKEAWESFYDLPQIAAGYLPALLETVNIALTATLLGGIGAMAMSLLSTRGLAPWPWLAPVFRRFTDVLRAIPDIVLALVLIYVLGSGPAPAMIAIAVHTVGALGKLFSEVNENVDRGQVQGVAATGASWMQRMWFGVVPQVSPNYLSYFLLRVEINVRASAILGFVGAGGIGYDLKNTISWGQGKYDESAAIFILLFITIVTIDQISSFIRGRLSGQTEARSA